MDFTNSITWGGGLRGGGLLIRSEEKYELKWLYINIFTTICGFFNWEITRLIQLHDCLFIDPRISWWSHSYMYQSLTGLQFRKVINNWYQFPLCRVVSQLDVVTLSSNVFSSCTIQNNCGNFFNLDSRFAKAGRRLGPVYMEVGVPRLVSWPS